jgi:hypothetical protein
MTTDNLRNRIWNAKYGKIEDTSNTLSDQEKAEILAMVGNRCRAETKRKLARRLDLPLSLWDSFGIYDRVKFANGRVDYITGQDYTYEMRTLRECILNH